MIKLLIRYTSYAPMKDIDLSFLNYDCNGIGMAAINRYMLSSHINAI